ncbi:MAG: aminotransferase class I/II-fold pyridoxal phosphate-dependent enzyme, partial [Bryobacteraceae bacterium]
MNACLSEKQKDEFLRRGFSRRSFGRIAALVSGGAAALPFFNEPAMAQLSALHGAIPPDAVMINANENPLGPCPEAREAVKAIVDKGGRYLYQETFAFQDTLAEQEGLKSSYVMPFAGSSAPLHQSVVAFTSPTRAFVTADPGYEAGERAAHYINAKLIRVPLTKTFAHDVRAMVAADPSPGLFYICNPNNPTGTLTPKEDIEWLVANKPAGSVVMIDEAYTHIAGAPFMT